MRGGVVAVLVLVVAMTPLTTAVLSAEGGPYLARTVWSAKHLTSLDRMWLLLREPWEAKPTGEGVRVAIVDTGLDPTHPDLEDSVVAWKDFIAGRPDPYDDNGHGTHVAAILAGRGHLQWNPFSSYWMTGERGIAPSAALIVAKAMRADGTGDDVTVAAAIRWALDPDGDRDTSDGASIINLSVGLEPGGLAVAGGPAELAIAEAVRAGAVVVVASGNEGMDRVTPPATAAGAIVVGAVDSGGRVADFSNWGPEVDLVAPGILVSAYPRDLDGNDIVRDGYTGMAGTSMAVPVVAGVAALMMEADPSLTRTSLREDLAGKVALVEAILRDTAHDLEDPRAGSGLVDAHGALRLVDRGTEAWDPAFLAAAAAAATGLGLAVWTVRRRAPEPAV